MSIKYLESNNEYQDFQSRYQVLRVISETDSNNKTSSTYLETYNQVEIPETSEDQYHVVTESEVNRLDLISNKFYGTPNNWWMIAIANNFIDPFVVNEGAMIRIPSLLTVSDFRYKILSR